MCDAFLQSVSFFGASSLGAFIVFFFIKSYIPAYLSKKADNLATREDIAGITEEVERVRNQYSILLEELKAKHQLRLAALDRRLQAHQESFSLWRELYAKSRTPEQGDAVLKCQKWWEENCLYLEPKVREAFVASYSAVSCHEGLLQANADVEVLKSNWREVMQFPNILFESIQLPPLTTIETKSLKLDSQQGERV